MSIRVALHHQTRYRYDRAVGMGPQSIRLRPAPHSRAAVIGYSQRVEPEDHFLNWQQDPQSNWLARIVFPKPIKQFTVTVDLIAELSPINPFDFFLESYAHDYPFRYAKELEEELRPYRVCLPQDGEACGPKFEEMLASVDTSKQVTVDFLVAVNQMVEQSLGYTLRMDPGVQLPEQTLTIGRGSCRDFAWLLVQLLRRLGLAARFVSGYSIQLAPDEKPLEGPAGVSQDVVDLHAWAEVYLPGAGWVGLDATSGMMCTEGHVPLAASPEPGSAAPITGTHERCEVEFEHEMTVTRIHEDPRVTKPYTDGQWVDITRLAHDVDQRMTAADMRLTMGGEPTFVSIDDYESAQWNTAAVGQHKLDRSIALVKRLRDRWGAGGLLHCGQGKWYPGEQLPRWALAVYWREDGQPLWANDELLADPDKDLGHTVEDARAFAAQLAGRLGVDPRYAIAAYEDPVHFAWQEKRLPVNVDPFDNKLESEEDRTRLLRVFENGLGNPTGYVLPVRRQLRDGEMVWESSLWTLRTNTKKQRRVILMPGDSPIGLRLPSPSLAWVPASSYPHLYPPDPTVQRDPLPQYEKLAAAVTMDERRQQFVDRVLAIEESAFEQPESANPEGVVRTAMAVQPRGGVLHVFMPPTETLEDYIALLAAIEATAAALKKPVVIEGYTPPGDHRVQHIKVTPDPGVIEVNVHPARNWDELQRITLELYEDAKQARLGTEKFMLDGKHTGTGGGNHVVVGGATPLDSPWLRRPALLRSVVSYWLNHPSLSYLFSGLFIGPTSQAPRADEGRSDSVYELEIALQQIAPPGLGPDTPPWLVDRVFRHLLTDLTGNTHRSEICIDKLYSPDSATGRLGLVEFRGLEMPPHARMSLTQMLLLRSILLMLWERPYTQRLRRWGPELHDRFMLPTCVIDDFTEVLHDLSEAGIPIDSAWFDPHIEFRFPVAGHVEVDDISVELRTAIEPWHVLGEEPAGGGTARFVDSSLERMQVKVQGLDPRADAFHSDRYAVAVNGITLPLQPTGKHLESVCGVRYRAWQPPSCLHPTIPTHTPLVFDIVDRWHSRAVGGCTYHVAHPGGRSYDTFPVNALEAEARRRARFFAHGHTPGTYQLRQAPANRELTYTLDLRRVPS